MYLTIIYLYVLLRFVYPLPFSILRRVGIGLALLAVSRYHLITELTFGNMWSPELPYFVVLVLGWLFCSFVLLAIFTICADVILVLMLLTRNRDAVQRAGTSVRAGVALMALGFAGWGAYQAVQVPSVHRVELSIKNLPPDLDGFRFVQLSDLHISRLFPEAWTRAVVDRTNTLAPDLVVISGDFIDGTTSARKRDVAPLRDLRAQFGVIGIPGNHEYYFDYAAWQPALEALGIRMLVNEHVVLRRRSAELAIAGVTDEAATSYGFAGPDLRRAIADTPATAPIILLSHRPQGAVANAAAGVAVQLSGHTHGGMIRILNGITAYANEGFVSRGYQVGNMTLYVSNGTGLWMGFPIRLWVPSEITEFVLRPAR